MSDFNLEQRFDVMPPIVKAAILRLIEWEERVDHMGYDICYYQEDLPEVVRRAIAGWKDYC